MQSSFEDIIIKTDPRAEPSGYAIICGLLAPVCLVGGALAIGLQVAPNWVAALPLPVYQLLMATCTAPMVIGWILLELLFFEGFRADRFLVWIGIAHGKVFRSDSVRMGLMFGVLLCCLWAGVLLGFFWRITHGLPSFWVAVGIAACLGGAYWHTIDMYPELTPEQLREIDAEQKPKQVGTPAAQLAEPTQVAQATTRATKYDFTWEMSPLNLGKLCGMEDLKDELTAAIGGFRGYSNDSSVSDRNGILLSGPPGNGKTTFAMAIAGELGLPIVKLSCQDLTSKWINESPAVIKDLFAQAAQLPCVVFFDEFDGVGMSRGDDGQHSENKKTVTALLSEIDSARSKRIVIVAATNFVEQIDPALIRDGRFDFRIEIPYPDLQARTAILQGLIERFQVPVAPGVVDRVAQLWERRSVAFMEATVKRLRDQRGAGSVVAASAEDFKQAARDASRRASAIPKEGKKLSEIALTSEVRREANSLIYRLRNWEEIQDRGGEPPSGVLLYGPPGTGKTSFVRALARELGFWHVFEVNTAEILQTPRKFKDVMELASQHRPAIVFLDEADELLRDRSYSNSVTATNEILKAMDGMMGKVPEVVLMAATNNTDVIDQAALRGGRFGEKIYMGPLQDDDLLRFVELEFQSRANVTFAPDLTPKSLAERLQSAAPADVISLLRKAVNYTFEQSVAPRAVCMDDVSRAIRSQSVA